VLVVLAVIAAAGTTARSEPAHHILIGVIADACFDVTIEGVEHPPVIVSDELGIMCFVLELDELPPGPLTINIQSTPCDTTAFEICPGQCGVRPQEEIP
jgi:hypothetical protein